MDNEVEGIAGGEDILWTESALETELWFSPRAPKVSERMAACA